MYVDFGLPKVVLPVQHMDVCVILFWLLWSHYSGTFEAAGGVLSVMSQPQKQGCHTLQRIDLARPFLVSPAIKIEIENSLGMALSKAKSGCVAIPFLAVWNLASCSRHEALRITEVDQRFCLSSKLSTQQYSIDTVSSHYR